MAKKKTITYKCSQCGYTQPKWLGRCPECGAWNSLEECVVDPNISSLVNPGNIAQKVKPVPLDSIESMADDRWSTGIGEFDRVLGGKGATIRSAVLLGGEPGIGKSTLLLQTASKFAMQHPDSVLYVSGEESAGQIKARSDRLGLDVKGIQIMSAMRLEDVMEALNELSPKLVIIDSIQTCYSVEGGIIPGTVSQLKYCCNELTCWVKEHDSVLIMTCHVTKDGAIAGPKALEHLVDTVISFERNNDELRFLRAHKNRFGSVDELGIFEMTEKGLVAVEDPSAMFITRRDGEMPAGVAVAAVFEGTRVFLVEIQALTVPAKSSVTRVFSDKIDSARVSRVAAVLEKRTGLRFSDQDIYINVAGGVRLTESAIDTALAASLYSARTNVAVSAKTVLIGELSLAGEIRPVGRIKARAKTAASLGYDCVVAPEKEEGVKVVKDIKNLVKEIFG
ncbi:MAG: DNA repair protein RadA [Treponema sp.]|nr:DNA repair protein RadA [Treponema sp.]